MPRLNVGGCIADKDRSLRVKRRLETDSSSGAKPREWIALAGGAVQEARTEGPDLALIGQPLVCRPDPGVAGRLPGL